MQLRRKILETVESLLKAGADPSVYQHDGNPVLRSAIVMRDQQAVDFTRLLVENGANVNVLDKHGYALLPTAAQEGKLEGIVQILLDAGADVDGNTEVLAPIILH